MLKRLAKDERGFTLMMAIFIIMVLTITIPAIITLVRQDSKETVRSARSASAFHLAEAGIDQGIWKLQESVDVWNAALAGTAISGYTGSDLYSMTFAKGDGGQYNITFSSGPDSGEVTILAKARESTNNEIRAIQAVVEQGAGGEFAIQAKNTSSFGAATNVEWGPVIGRTSITSGSKAHPRMMSAGNITPNDTSGSADPNTDSVQWWSYKQDLPAEPEIDLTSYKEDAVAAGTSADSDCGVYYKTSAFNFRGCTDATGSVFYVEGNCNFQTGSGGNYIKGDVICTGDFSVTGNGGGYYVMTATVPSQAWVEYGNDWSFYKTTYDPSCPHATYAAATNANYEPTGLTYDIEVLIHGFVYTGGSQGLTGGGNAKIVGALYSANNTNMSTSNCTLFFDPDVSESIRTTNVIISRKSWKEVTGQSFP
jgi:Tfp pilus assembly protein PilX